MIPGSTPTYEFYLFYEDESPIDSSIVSDLRVTFKQWNSIIVQKDLSECTLIGNALLVDLSQEETLKFDSQKQLRVQVKIKSKNGKVFYTDPYDIDCEESLDNEVI